MFYFIFQTPVSTRFLLGSTSQIVEAKVPPCAFSILGKFSWQQFSTVWWQYVFNFHNHHKDRGFAVSYEPRLMNAGIPFPLFPLLKRQRS